MRHSKRIPLQGSALFKPAICVALAAAAMSVAPTAMATWDASPGSDFVWCNGDGTAYAPIPGYPADTNPFGLKNGKNPLDTWDVWISYEDYLKKYSKEGDKAYSPLSNPPNLSNILLTESPFAVPSMINDVYAVQLNYWNSVSNAANPGAANEKVPFGHSPGHSCLVFTDTGTDKKSGGSFTITYPASPSTTSQKEVDFHNSNPNDFPQFVPFSTGPTAGAPTGYVSTYKGCSWDGNSCTLGSVVPKGVLLDSNGKPVLDSNGKTVPTKPVQSSDINVFPVELNWAAKIPTSWSIAANLPYGDPFVKDKSKQAWDASWDIWFDKTAHTDEGLAPYGNVRGQNDGLEIMIWMNHNGSYVDAITDGVPHENQPGLIQPAGHLRERVAIGGTIYDVWVARLNNPYFGYADSEVIDPDKAPGECKGTKFQNGGGTTCGTEWNVVSFVATKDFNKKDHRKLSAAIDVKVFTNYIFGKHFPTGTGVADWTVFASYAKDNRDADGVLRCPASALHQEVTAPTGACLSSNWYLMSIQAGFETWIGGNGLQSKSFDAYVLPSTNSHLTVRTTVNGKDWGTGYCRDVWVRNADTFPVYAWQVQMDLPYYPSNIYQAWNIKYSQAGKIAVFSNGEPWNSTINPFQEIRVGGFCATK